MTALNSVTALNATPFPVDQCSGVTEYLSCCNWNTPSNALTECLAQFEGAIVIQDRTFVANSIPRGQLSSSGMQFYKDVDGHEFIYFDNLYDEWRIGGGSGVTHSVDCSSVPICA